LPIDSLTYRTLFMSAIRN